MIDFEYLDLALDAYWDEHDRPASKWTDPRGTVLALDTTGYIVSRVLIRNEEGTAWMLPHSQGKYL